MKCWRCGCGSNCGGEGGGTVAAGVTRWLRRWGWHGGVSVSYMRGSPRMVVGCVNGHGIMAGDWRQRYKRWAKARIRRIFLDGYGVLVVRTIFFRFLCLSSRMLTLFDAIIMLFKGRVKAKAKMGKKDMKESVPRDLHVVPPYVPPTPFLGHLKKQKDNPYKTRETVELEYDIPLQDGVMQPLTPQIVHITPPDDDYVASATNPILDKHLNEFRKEFFDMTRVDENGNFIEDIKDLSIKMHVECETFIQKLLNRVSQLLKSSNETGKTRREMKSHQRYSSKLSFSYRVANLRPHGVHCYSHSHLISSEGRNTLLLESHSKEMEFEVSSTRIIW
ncbi:hypothetical protein Tco_1563752 [Tanacetum coccineum]